MRHISVHHGNLLHAVPRSCLPSPPASGPAMCEETDENNEEDEDRKSSNGTVDDDLLWPSQPSQVYIFTPVPIIAIITPARRRVLLCDVTTISMNAVILQALWTLGEVSAPRRLCRGCCDCTVVSVAMVMAKGRRQPGRLLRGIPAGQ